MKQVNFVSKDVQRILSSHKSIINRKCLTRKLFLKILQHSQERNLFFNKNSGFHLPPSFIKKRLEHRCCEHWQIFKNTYFEEHLQTAVSESFTWTFSYMNKEHRKGRRRFLKNKTKQKPFEKSAIWKKLAFSWCSLSFRFSLFSTSRQTAFALHNKIWY